MLDWRITETVTPRCCQVSLHHQPAPAVRRRAAIGRLHPCCAGASCRGMSHIGSLSKHGIEDGKSWWIMNDWLWYGKDFSDTHNFHILTENVPIDQTILRAVWQLSFSYLFVRLILQIPCATKDLLILLCKEWWRDSLQYPVMVSLKNSMALEVKSMGWWFPLQATNLLVRFW